MKFSLILVNSRFYHGEYNRNLIHDLSHINIVSQRFLYYHKQVLRLNSTVINEVQYHRFFQHHLARN